MSIWHLLLSDDPKENEEGAPPPPKAVWCQSFRTYTSLLRVRRGMRLAAGGGRSVSMSPRDLTLTRLADAAWVFDDAHSNNTCA